MGRRGRYGEEDGRRVKGGWGMGRRVKRIWSSVQKICTHLYCTCVHHNTQ